MCKGAARDATFFSAWYLPLISNHPEQRPEHILQDSGCVSLDIKMTQVWGVGLLGDRIAQTHVASFWRNMFSFQPPKHPILVRRKACAPAKSAGAASKSSA